MQENLRTKSIGENVCFKDEDGVSIARGKRLSLVVNVRGLLLNTSKTMMRRQAKQTWWWKGYREAGKHICYWLYLGGGVYHQDSSKEIIGTDV